jgi:hypothetical protein
VFCKNLRKMANIPADPVRCEDSPPADPGAAAGRADVVAVVDIAVAAVDIAVAVAAAAFVVAGDTQPGAESRSDRFPKNIGIHQLVEWSGCLHIVDKMFLK